jgi:hypothetical protein
MSRANVPREAKASHSAAEAHQIVQDCLHSRHGLKNIFVPSFNNVEGVIWYDVAVIGDDIVRWTVSRRFNEFFLLNQEIEARVRVSHALPPFPEKYSKTLHDHQSHNFCETRRNLLQNYLQKINQISSLQSCEPFLDFLNPGKDEKAEEVSSRDSAFRAEAKLEKKTWGYTCSECTSVSVPTAQILKRDHVVYQINCENLNKRESFRTWTVLRRYEEFYGLDAHLRTVLIILK